MRHNTMDEQLRQQCLTHALDLSNQVIRSDQGALTPEQVVAAAQTFEAYITGTKK